MDENYYTYESTVWDCDKATVYIRIPTEIKDDPVIKKQLYNIATLSRHYMKLRHKLYSLRNEKDNCRFDFQKQDLDRDIEVTDNIYNYIAEKLDKKFSPYVFYIVQGEKDDEIVFTLNKRTVD